MIITYYYKNRTIKTIYCNVPNDIAIEKVVSALKPNNNFDKVKVVVLHNGRTLVYDNQLKKTK